MVTCSPVSSGIATNAPPIPTRDPTVPASMPVSSESHFCRFTSGGGACSEEHLLLAAEKAKRLNDMLA